MDQEYFKTFSLNVNASWSCYMDQDDDDDDDDGKQLTTVKSGSMCTTC